MNLNNPTVNITVNKSRLKRYTSINEMPTYFLRNQSEFQIEIFNPTDNVVMAKIKLNDKSISQGGLVIKPGERVFLERYLNNPTKFLFETYEVENSNEVISAIKNNGGIKVEFYEELIYTNLLPNYQDLRFNLFDASSNNTAGNYNTLGSTTNAVTTTTPYATTTSNSSIFSTNSFTDNQSLNRAINVGTSSMAIETGRVQSGGFSEQKMVKVNKNFSYVPFYSVEYKLLPISQKINTVKDLNVKVYCKNCGKKAGKTDRFCGSCGFKL